MTNEIEADGFKYEIDIIGANDVSDLSRAQKRKADGWQIVNISIAPAGYFREIWRRRE